MKHNLLFKSLAFLSLLFVLVLADALGSKLKESSDSGAVQIYSYRIVNTYHHDKEAFTQGLAFEGGYLYESTGLNGRSSLRKVDLKTGKVLKIRKLSHEHFAEGITIIGNRIIQLTYQSNIGFVYDKKSFKLLKTFNYIGEGWGITHDGTYLIMSDGTAKLRYLDPETFQEVKTVLVHYKNKPISNINELEFVRGEIYANIWKEDRIAIIGKTGQVNGWIELQGLLKPHEIIGGDAVLNGIAYDAANDRFFVTGKFWPKLFEIKLVRLQ